jgi:three-Cys-motif partner protein
MPELAGSSILAEGTPSHSAAPLGRAMTPDSPLWPLGEQTPGKHLVLRNYLNAWLPILGMTHDRIVFIDGFAGPGEYEGGEPGSPIIALRALKEHVARTRFLAEIKFVFVELDPKRVEHLERLVAIEKKDLPPRCDTLVVGDRFDATMTTLLDGLESGMQTLAPCFLMVDPFGVSDTPMSVIQRVLRHPKSEVYISFMYEAINRFKNTSEFAPHLDSLFGHPGWRAGLDIEDPARKRDFFYNFYRDQLKQAGAQYVLHFDLYQGGRLVYAIFFGTKHLLGCDRMKQAIWKVAPFGDYAFRGTRSDQLGLDLAQIDLGQLAGELREAFPGRDWIAVEEATEFTQSDRTDYHSGHLKKALVHLERAAQLEVKPGTRKRVRTFPDGTIFRFK